MQDIADYNDPLAILLARECDEDELDESWEPKGSSRAPTIELERLTEPCQDLTCWNRFNFTGEQP
jgi:hypothetical protein